MGRLTPGRRAASTYSSTQCSGHISRTCRVDVRLDDAGHPAKQVALGHDGARRSSSSGHGSSLAALCSERQAAATSGGAGGGEGLAAGSKP